MEINKHIIEQCKRKDEAAYRSIYQAYAPYVYAIIKNYFTKPVEREDMLQEVFAHIFSSIHRFDPKKGAFKSWISKITSNRCAVQLRSRNKMHVVYSLEEVEDRGESVQVLEDLKRKDLEQLLASMPDGYRTVFLLNVVDGYSHQEISDLLDIKVQTSRSQLARAIKWIKRHAKVKLGILNLLGYGT
ncbi:MAG: sigma-70 family RNA polymerase sigma factor [Bacteroidota bacterium]